LLVPEWLSDKSWGEFCRLSDIAAFNGLREDITANAADWQAIYDADLPHRERLPRHW
jgi:dynein heavy chain